MDRREIIFSKIREIDEILERETEILIRERKILNIFEELRTEFNNPIKLVRDYELKDLDKYLERFLKKIEEKHSEERTEFNYATKEEQKFYEPKKKKIKEIKKRIEILRDFIECWRDCLKIGIMRVLVMKNVGWELRKFEIRLPGLFFPSGLGTPILLRKIKRIMGTGVIIEKIINVTSNQLQKDYFLEKKDFENYKIIEFISDDWRLNFSA